VPICDVTYLSYDPDVQQRAPALIRASPKGLLAAFGLPPVFVSVDLDSWIHCRWASGSNDSLWSSSYEGFLQVYGIPRPGREFDHAIDTTLGFLDEQKLRVTFFVLSEIAELYPKLLRLLDGLGHEVALHGKHHVDNSQFTGVEFRAMICESRNLLQDILGKAVVGYRAANLILSSDQLVILDEEGFSYDSSVCASRKFFGKFGAMGNAPLTPYHPSRGDLAVSGELRILELPLGVFPAVRLPCSTGVMTRVLGSWWGKIGTAAMLRNGYASYYFHPYELSPVLTAPLHDVYVRFFLRNCGEVFRRQLISLLAMLKRQGNFLRGCDIAGVIHGYQNA